MARQRIVINLDAPPNGPTGPAPGRGPQVANRGKRRRWPKVLGILFAIFLIAAGAVAIGGFFLWRHYQSTPAYALSVMLDAAQRGDTVEFQKRLDDEQIAKNMANTVSQKAAARYGLALSNKVKSQIDSSMPSLLEQLKPAIHEEVAKEIKEFASKSEPRPFIFLVIAVPSLMTIKSDGNSATASALLNDRRFQISMWRSDDGWKVTNYEDDVVVQRIVDRVMAQLPAIGGFDFNSPAVKPGKRKPRRR